MGSVKKFPWAIGGEVAAHSKVVASQGFSSDFDFFLNVNTMFSMNKIWNMPIIQAPQVIHSFRNITGCAWSYSKPPSYKRRDTPAMPCTIMGANTRFIPIRVPAK